MEKKDEQPAAKRAKQDVERLVPVSAISLFNLPIELQANIGTWSSFSDLAILHAVSPAGQDMLHKTLQRLRRIVIDVRDRQFCKYNYSRESKAFFRRCCLEGKTICQSVNISNIQAIWGDCDVTDSIQLLTKLQEIEFTEAFDSLNLNDLIISRFSEALCMLFPNVFAELTSFVWSEPTKENIVTRTAQRDLENTRQQAIEKIIQQFNHSPMRVLCLPAFIQFSEQDMKKWLTTTNVQRLQRLEIACPWPSVCEQMNTPWKAQNIQIIKLTWNTQRVGFEEEKAHRQRVTALANLVQSCPRLLSAHVMVKFADDPDQNAFDIGWSYASANNPWRTTIDTAESSEEHDMDLLEAIQPLGAMRYRANEMRIRAKSSLNHQLALLSQKMIDINRVWVFDHYRNNEEVLADLHIDEQKLSNNLTVLAQRGVKSFGLFGMQNSQARFGLDLDAGCVRCTILGHSQNLRLAPWFRVFQLVTKNKWSVCDFVAPRALENESNHLRRSPVQRQRLYNMIDLLVEVGQSSLRTVSFRYEQGAQNKGTGVNAWKWIQEWLERSRSMSSDSLYKNRVLSEKMTMDLIDLLDPVIEVKRFDYGPGGYEPGMTIHPDKINPRSPGLLRLRHLTELDLSRFILRYGRSVGFVTDTMRYATLKNQYTLTKLKLLLHVDSQFDVNPLKLLDRDQYTHLHFQIMWTGWYKSKKGVEHTTLLSRDFLARFFDSHQKLESFTWLVNSDSILDAKTFETSQSLFRPFPRLLKGQHKSLQHLNMTVWDCAVFWEELPAIWHDFPNLESLGLRLGDPNNKRQDEKFAMQIQVQQKLIKSQIRTMCPPKLQALVIDTPHQDQTIEPSTIANDPRKLSRQDTLWIELDEKTQLQWLQQPMSTTGAFSTTSMWIPNDPIPPEHLKSTALLRLLESISR